MEVKRGKDVGRRSGAADVSATPRANRAPDIAAHLTGFTLQFPDQMVFRFVHGHSPDCRRFCRWIVAEKSMIGDFRRVAAKHVARAPARCDASRPVIDLRRFRAYT